MFLGVDGVEYTATLGAEDVDECDSLRVPPPTPPLTPGLSAAAAAPAAFEALPPPNRTRLAYSLFLSGEVSIVALPWRAVAATAALIPAV